MLFTLSKIANLLRSSARRKRKSKMGYGKFVLTLEAVGVEKDLELENLATELNNLEIYSKLNYMGFSKLLKKHDKHRYS
jgi:SPX domain protein involved in polyphosphate accumulation